MGQWNFAWGGGGKAGDGGGSGKLWHTNHLDRMYDTSYLTAAGVGDK